MNTYSQTTALSGNLGLSINSGDWQNGAWVRPSQPIVCGGTVNSGDMATLSLQVLSEAPQEIYLYGAASLALASFGTIVNLPIGGGGGNFKVGTPNATTLVSSGQVKGTWQKSDGTVSVPYEMDFKLQMPWDGTVAHWTGTWSMSWTVQLDTPQPPTGLHVRSVAPQ